MIRLDKIGILQALGRQANPATKGEVNIIDVSAYTGEIDFGQLEPHVSGALQPKIHAAIIRLTDGTAFDNRFELNYDGFKALGLPVGGYGVHYGRATATANKKQAEKLIEAVNVLGEYPALGVYGDWERNPDKITISLMRQAIWKYILTYEAAFGEGKLGAYTNSWWDTYVANEKNGATDIPKNRENWFASWYAPTPYIPWDWRQRFGEDCWVLWQYENRFKFPGVPGSVDMSTFNGSLSQFYKHFKLGEPPPGVYEMRYRVAIEGLRIREQPDANAKQVGMRVKGEVVTPLDTIGDNVRSKSYWVKDEKGWSAAQWMGVEYMEPFV
jgi:GH25 family lysozyme M1 (1,4-beta-N-acetylmuramidase)